MHPTPPNTQSGKNPKKRLRIASYNIRKAVGLDWKRDADRIIRVIREIDADVIALQEADKRWGSRQGTLPTNSLRDLHYYYFVDFDKRCTNKNEVDYNNLSHGWHGNAILYRTPLQQVSAEKIKLPTLEPRGAVSTVLETPDHNFQFIGTHLSLLGHMRARQVRYLSNKVSDAPFQLPTIIAGDFNEWRKTGKAHRAAGHGFEVITPGPSYHATRPTIPLDRFVVWGDIRVHKTGVHATPLAKRASDHLPVYMDVSF